MSKYSDKVKRRTLAAQLAAIEDSVPVALPPPELEARTVEWLRVAAKDRDTEPLLKQVEALKAECARRAATLLQAERRIADLQSQLAAAKMETHRLAGELRRYDGLAAALATLRKAVAQ